MGVTGLWSLVEPAGKPVPLESLENKILAVDVSIWLNQAVKGFRDKTGNAVHNAHILGLFHRICKLLFYRIRPIFVFDGQAPQLKKETLRRRRMKASKAGKQARVASAKILDNYVRSQVVAAQLQRQSMAMGKVLARGQEGLASALNNRSKQQEKDLFELPPMPKDESNLDAHLSDSEEDEARERLMSTFNLSDIHKLDVDAKEFKRLPKNIQYEILTELKEKRKQNSWGKMAEMPKKAENFSGFQMERLIKRRQMQKTLEDVGKQLGEESASAFETNLFVGDVAGIKKARAESRKIESSSSGKQYLYISGLKNKNSLNSSVEEDEDNPDSPDEYEDPSELIAESMALSGDMSQEDILELIQSQKSAGMNESGTSKNLEDSDEDLLEPSTQNRTSNRKGGGLRAGIMIDAIKPTCSKLLDPEPVSQPTVVKNPGEDSSSSDEECGFMSDEATSQSDREDLFADVFTSQENHSKLSDILQNSTEKVDTSSKTQESSSEIVSISLDDIKNGVDIKEEDDIFADCFEEAVIQKPEATPQKITSKKPDFRQLGDILKSRTLESKSPIENVSSSSSDDGSFIDVADEEVQEMSSSGCESEAEAPLKNLDRCETTEDVFSFISKHARRPIKILPKRVSTSTQNSNLNLQVESTSQQSTSSLLSALASTSAQSHSRDQSPSRSESLIEIGQELVAKKKSELLQKTESSESPVTSSKSVIEIGQELVAKKKAALLDSQAKKIEPNLIALESLDSEDEKPNGTDQDKGLFREQIADTMKKSDHLWLKIASKWATDDTKPKQVPLTATSTTPNKVTLSKATPAKSAMLLNAKVNNGLPDFEEESTKLLQEMRSNVKEERLLRIKNLDIQKTELSKSSTSEKPDIDQATLAHLGVEMLDQTSYEKKVAHEEGLETTKPVEKEVIFGSSAPGFVRSVSEKSQSVVEIEPQNGETGFQTGYDSFMPDMQSAVDKLDDEGALLSRDELIALQNSLAKEQQALIAERSNTERMAATISDQMYSDCQELLQLFGLPWIVSPSEAEAQCAFLDMNGLSHGTITDDSDVWVFGGQKVYKNFFNQSKFCEQFMASDIANHFGLSREKMILLAELTGSDYTEGVESVGPVTALEIIADFPGTGIEPLEQFKIWWEKHQQDLTLPPGSKLKEKLVRLRLPSDFPSEQVYMAYLNPSVDNSTEKFTWAIPNLVAVRDYAADKFGWPWLKIDEMLKPVIKKLSSKVTQERIDNFFMSERYSLPEKGNYQSSKRIKQAIEKVLGKSPEKPVTNRAKRKREDFGKKSNEQEEEQEEVVNKRKRKNVSSKQNVAAKQNNLIDQEVDSVSEPKDWKKEEEMKKEIAKQKAIEVLKSKSQNETKPKRVVTFASTEESDLGNSPPSQQYFSDREEEFETEQSETLPKADKQTTVSTLSNVRSVKDSSTVEMSEHRKEELKRREDARKKNVAEMKKKWKSQFLSLGMKKAPAAVPSSSVGAAAANSQPARPRAKPKKTAKESATSEKGKKRKNDSEESASTAQISIPGPSGVGSSLVGRAVRVHFEQPPVAGAAPQGPWDRKKEEEAKKEAARQQAIKIFKKSAAKRAKKAALHAPPRVVLPKHELSESESD